VVSQTETTQQPQACDTYVCRSTVNVNLLEGWEFDLLSAAGKLLNFFIAAAFLCTELVAWEGQDFKAL